MAFGDVFAGYEEAAGKHYQNLLQQDYENKRSIAERYAKIADDPTYDERTRGEAQKRSIHTLTFQPLEKLPKEYENFTMQVQPPAPPPVNAPGGAGATNQPIGQTLSGPAGDIGRTAAALTGSPATATPPNTGPTGQSSPDQTIQPPTPPPHDLAAMMPFQQQVDRTAAMATAKAAGQYGIAGMKAAIPVKQGVDTVQGDDGRRYHSYVYQRRNPDTGVMERFNIQEDQPLGFFAARANAVNSVANLKKWAAEGNSVLNEAGKPLDLSSLDENSLLQHIGEDRYIPYTEKKELRDIGGQETPYGPISGTVGEPKGLAQGSLAKTRETTVPLPLGGLGKTGLTSTTQAPGPVGAPVPPPGAATPPQAGPNMTQGPTPEAMQALQQANPNVDPRVLAAALQSNLPPAGGGAAQAPSAPPQNVLPAPTPPSSGVTPIPGAGHGLSSEQGIDQTKRVEAFSNTIDRTMGIMDAIDDPKFGFADFLKRAKLAIDSNPTTPMSVVISNMAKVSPKEAKFVADFTSLAEDINVLRSTYGATGFRGAEAFSVLLGQRGNILGNPAIFKETLKNTLQSVVSQMEPISQGLANSGIVRAPTPGLVKAYSVLGEKTATGPNGDLLALRGRKWVDVMTGKPVQ